MLRSLILLAGLLSLHINSLSAAQAPPSARAVSASGQQVAAPASSPSVAIGFLSPKKEIKRTLKRLGSFNSMPKLIRYSLLFMAAALGIFIIGGMIGLFASQAIQLFWYVGSAAVLASLVCLILWIAEQA